jgi:hypothetical protein
VLARQLLVHSSVLFCIDGVLRFTLQKQKREE